MRKLIVEQTGSVQVEAERRFVVEVPDDVTDEQAEELLREMQDATDVDEVEWTDDGGRHWVGFDVECVETEVHDPDTVVGSPGVTGLRVIRLDTPAEMDMQ